MRHRGRRTEGTGGREQPARWACWVAPGDLPAPLRAYLSLVVAGWAVATLVAAALAPLRARDLVVAAVLLGCATLSVEATRRLDEPAGVMARDVMTVWTLPAALLLPPVYALLSALPITVLTQLRVRRAPVYRRVFSVAALGLAAGTASLVADLGGPSLHRAVTDGGQIGLLVALGVSAAAAVAALAVNFLLVGTAVVAADPEASWPALLKEQQGFLPEAAEVGTGLLVALAAARVPAAAGLALPAAVALQRSLLHHQLRAAARTDGKTGLLNAVTWEREAAGRLAEARRTGAAVAVLLLDVDRFKTVNDSYGHLVGDQVLAAVAAALTEDAREYDLVGRVGGEEFALLLPHTDVYAAQAAAERLRAKIGSLGVPLPSGLAVRITVSVGLAVLDPRFADVTEFLAAADGALYRAKAAGRNRVRLSALDPA